MIKRRYFRREHMPALVEWLSARPEGRSQLLIGAAPDRAATLAELHDLLMLDPELLRWVVLMLRSGDLEIRTTPARPVWPEGKPRPDWICDLSELENWQG